MSPKIVYPAFALSLLFNFMMGGKLLSGMSTDTEDSSLDSLVNEEDDIESVVQFGPSTFGYSDDYEDSDPLKQLERIQQERESILGKKSDFDYLRRSDFYDLAYSYK